MMNKINYHNELEKIVENLQSLKKRPKLLLHSCCAPCSSYSLEFLYRFFEVTIFFYNPNLYPNDEFKIRLEEQQRFCREFSEKVVIPAGFQELKVLSKEFDHQEFYNKVKGFENEKEGGKRCELCFDLRLKETFNLAQELNIEYTATTLTISPLKKATTINNIGKSLENSFNSITYLQTDFKKKGGFLRSTKLSEEFNLYRQNYCGCTFSYQEMKKRNERESWKKKIA